MLRRLFLDHPAAVGESYGEHLLVASRFGFAMIAGGAACLVHAFVPGWFRTTGSGTVDRLHRRMVTHRAAAGAGQVQAPMFDYVI